jgi:general secretion pathway protein G
MKNPSPRLARSGPADGYSFVELLIVTAILFILASAVMPLAQVASQRQRESELRAAL